MNNLKKLKLIPNGFIPPTFNVEVKVEFDGINVNYNRKIFDANYLVASKFIMNETTNAFFEPRKWESSYFLIQNRSGVLYSILSYKRFSSLYHKSNGYGYFVVKYIGAKNECINEKRRLLNELSDLPNQGRLYLP